VNSVALPETLTGHGVTLRRWRPTDAETLSRAVVESIEQLRPWMAWAANEPLTVGQRRALIAGWERTGDAGFAVLVEGQLAGSASLRPRGGPDTLEIGYWIRVGYTRRGIATAAARLLTDLAFTVEGVQRVEIHHDKANVASAGVPQRLEFQFVGERRDVAMAPSEVGIDCTWRVEREAWLGRG
jgi:RimJ/RimL family protein N-acetyltransferase